MEKRTVLNQFSSGFLSVVFHIQPKALLKTQVEVNPGRSQERPRTSVKVNKWF